jgi:hypothetical protein
MKFLVIVLGAGKSKNMTLLSAEGHPVVPHQGRRQKGKSIQEHESKKELTAHSCDANPVMQ